MSKYQHLFFDLDRTLWDFEANSEDMLKEIFFELSIDSKCKSFDSFHHKYVDINKQYWIDYRNHRITKEVLAWKRFYDTLIWCGIDDEELSKTFADKYVTGSPYKTKLFPNVIETLEKLKDHFQIHIISNGFKEVQFIKLEKSGLDKYTRTVTLSEEAEKPKPHKEFFDLALKKAQAKIENSLIIGDDLETDILGAKNYGLDYIWFNPNKIEPNTEVKQQINNFNQLNKYL